jgi:hypothetical protein
MRHYFARKKAKAREKARKANATKAAIRREGPMPDRPPPKGERMTAASEWEIVMRNRIDGAEGTFIPKSLNDLKRRVSVVIANYRPDTKP